MTQPRYSNMGRDIFDGSDMIGQTVATAPTSFETAKAVGTAARIVALLNMANGMPIEVIEIKVRR